MHADLLNHVEPLPLTPTASSVPSDAMAHLTLCRDVVSASSASAESAWNDFSVFMRRELLKPQEVGSHAVALVNAPKHGTVTFTDPARTSLTPTAQRFLSTTLTYRSEVGYLGADTGTFRVQSGALSYLVTVNFLVQPYVSEADGGSDECTAGGMDRPVQ